MLNFFKSKTKSKGLKINHIGYYNLQFRRVTDRWGKIGTFSSNYGYLRVDRCPTTGRFISQG